jgi:hypothetical protein
MKTRCYNQKDPRYKNYGVRGITICEEWLCSERVKGLKGGLTKGWSAFKTWAEENGYSDELTIDRIDNNKGYSPENCRWVTMKAQTNNRRNNKYIFYKGRTQTLAQWCEELQLNRNTVVSRLRANWSTEKAFEYK